MASPEIVLLSPICPGPRRPRAHGGADAGAQVLERLMVRKYGAESAEGLVKMRDFVTQRSRQVVHQIINAPAEAFGLNGACRAAQSPTRGLAMAIFFVQTFG